MDDTYIPNSNINKTKYSKYSNNKEQNNNISNGYCSTKFKNITTKSKNQLKTRDTTNINNRKKNYRKFQKNIEKNLDNTIEHNDILIESNKRNLIYVNDIIENKLSLYDNDADWVIC